MSTAYDQIKLNLPIGMRPILKARAAENRRSMTSEIVLMLERALRGEEAAGEGPEKAYPAAKRHGALQGAATTNG